MEVLLLSLHVFAWKQEAEDIILSMDPIMLPDPLLEPMNSADEDAVCDFIASKLDITLIYERKYIIMVCVYPRTLLNNSSTFFGFLSHRDILKTKDNPMELCAMCCL